jgi:hypothetical protein
MIKNALQIENCIGLLLRTSLALTFMVICNIAFAQVEESKVTKAKLPNIVFILADDHRWDYLSSMGHPFM